MGKKLSFWLVFFILFFLYLNNSYSADLTLQANNSTLKSNFEGTNDVLILNPKEEIISLEKNITRKLIVSGSKIVELDFYTSNENVISCTQAGLITTKEYGDANIVAIDNKSGDLFSFNIKVCPPVENISFVNKQIYMHPEDEKILKISTFPADSFPQSVRFLSSKPDSFSIDKNGKIVALKEGEGEAVAITNTRKIATAKVVVYSKDTILPTKDVENIDVVKCTKDDIRTILINHRKIDNLTGKLFLKINDNELVEKKADYQTLDIYKKLNVNHNVSFDFAKIKDKIVAKFNINCSVFDLLNLSLFSKPICVDLRALKIFKKYTIADDNSINFTSPINFNDIIPNEVIEEIEDIPDFLKTNLWLYLKNFINSIDIDKVVSALEETGDKKYSCILLPQFDKIQDLDDFSDLLSLNANEIFFFMKPQSRFKIDDDFVFLTFEFTNQHIAKLTIEPFVVSYEDSDYSNYDNKHTFVMPLTIQLLFTAYNDEVFAKNRLGETIYFPRCIE